MQLFIGHGDCDFASIFIDGCYIFTDAFLIGFGVRDEEVVRYGVIFVIFILDDVIYARCDAIGFIDIMWIGSDAKILGGLCISLFRLGFVFVPVFVVFCMDPFFIYSDPIFRLRESVRWRIIAVLYVFFTFFHGRFFIG